jgi:hypothetical protein
VFVLAALALAALSQPAVATGSGSVPRPTTATLSVTGYTTDGDWLRVPPWGAMRIEAIVTINGTVSAPAEVSARIQLGTKEFRTGVSVPAAGPFSLALEITRAAVTVAGNYPITVDGTSAGVPQPVELAWEAEPPWWGLLDNIVVSRTRGGPPLPIIGSEELVDGRFPDPPRFLVRSPVKKLWVRFSFLVPPPADHLVRVIWTAGDQCHPKEPIRATGAEPSRLDADGDDLGCE